MQLNFNKFCHGITSFYCKVEFHLGIADKLTKFAYFMLIRDTWDVERVPHLYVKEIARMHEISTNIVSDRDHIFQDRFW